MSLGEEEGDAALTRDGFPLRGDGSTSSRGERGSNASSNRSGSEEQQSLGGEE